MLRVASVPSSHPYVRRLGANVSRLPDPLDAEGRWWPPAMVDPGWIAAHAADFDLMHVHFGFESFPPAHLAETLEALREAERPLVLTVHDLENPQLTDQAAHEEQLDVLVPAADALITLTDGAARVIRARWGRTARVVAHPALLGTASPVGTAGPRPVVGLALRDLRPNVDGPAAVRAARAACRVLGAGLRVTMHDAVRDEAARDAVRALCTGDELHEGPRPDDLELARAIADCDVQVLPYGHGTHSGWVELCWDLGVPVAVPRLGCFAEQHPDPSFVRSFVPRSAASLQAALEPLLAAAPRPGSPERRALKGARRRARSVQHQQIAAAHLRAYEGAMRAFPRRVHAAA